MSRDRRRLWACPTQFRTGVLALSTLLVSASATALDVGLAGVIGSKALLIIGDASPQPVPVGQTVDGVKVVAIQGDQATLEIDGKKRNLRVGQYAQGALSEQGGKITLHADPQGHFFATGNINGASIRFLVDTGASLISLGESDARRIGIDLTQGTRAYSETANGRAVVTRVQLDTVRIGEITLHHVDALVHPTNLPMALLGMSFLNRMEMQRDGSTMTLKKRY